jgi:metallophosphoesterase (TIGR00282 family)
VKLLFIGDIDARVGRAAVEKILPSLQSELGLDFVVANGENATHGIGLSRTHAEELLNLGIDLLTLGDHAFDRDDIIPLLSSTKKVIRPINHPANQPGQGFSIIENGKGEKLLVINACGQVFMKYQYDNPFWAIDKVLKDYPNIPTLVDFHAEATSEKKAMGFFLDGRVTLVAGTHTHIQTSDEQILPNGTAYISDVGMVGAHLSVLGMTQESVLSRFLTQLPHGLKGVEEGPAVFGAVVVEFDMQGRATGIERINKIVEV